MEPDAEKEDLKELAVKMVFRTFSLENGGG